jgi:DNA-binding MarR family transcriptional regulator
MNTLNFLETLYATEVKFLNLFFNSIRFPKTSYPLTNSSARTLLLLHYQMEMPMSELAEKLHLEKGSFTAVAKKLETAGLIQRITPTEDRRKVLIRLTASGNKTAKVVLEHYVDQINDVFEKMTPEVRNALVKTVEQLDNDLNHAMVQVHAKG